MTIRSYYGSNRVTVGDRDAFFASPDTVGQPGVIWCHAYTHTTETLLNPRGRPYSWRAIQQIAREYPLVISDQAEDNWGNVAGAMTVADGIFALQSAALPTKAAQGPVTLVGTSMGFTTACVYARTQPSAIKGIVGVLPLVDMNDIYNRNWNGSVAAIDLAYGGDYDPAVHSNAHNPLSFAAALTFPIHLFVGATDPGATLAKAQEFAAAAPNVTITVLANVAHDTEDAFAAALAGDQFMQALREMAEA